MSEGLLMTDTWTWATVTQATPLRIKVDGDTTALDATTGDLVGSLAVDDRVRVHLHADGIIVTGIQGGAGDGQLPERLQTSGPDIRGLNLNDYWESGWYRGDNVINAPTDDWYYFQVIAHGSSWVVQFATRLYADRTFYRRKEGGVWQPWVEIAAYESDGRLKAADGVAADDVATVGQLIPIGGGITWWGPSDPASPGGGIEYAIPDGRALSRSTYSVLFALWGTAFGTGNGTSTFNMPNAKGRVQVGRDSADSDFNTMGETRGAKTHTHTLEDGWALIRMNDGESTAGYQSKLMPTSYSYPAKFTLDNARVDSLNSSLAIQLGGSTDADSSVQPSIVANTAIRIK